jgi:nickel-dependent lactate racemase
MVSPTATTAVVVKPELRLRTAVWYGDAVLALPLSEHWNLIVFRPTTPPPLADAEIERRLAAPCGLPPLREILRAKPPQKPLIIVDDPNRPTPASRIIPFLLREFQNAGVRSGGVRILVATGAPLQWIDTSVTWQG